MLPPTVFTKTGEVKQSEDVAGYIQQKMVVSDQAEVNWKIPSLQVQDVDVSIQKDPHWD